MLKLYLIRHAATLPNKQKRYPHPSEDADILPKAAVPKLPSGLLSYSSPSQRTLQTAKLCGYSSPKTEKRLTEAHFGIMAGATWAELEQRYGAEQARSWLEGLADPNSSLGPPQGETGQQFHKRLNSWLTDLPQQGEIVAFTHAGAIWGILRLTIALSRVLLPPATCLLLRKQGPEGIWYLEQLQSSQESMPQGA